MIPDSYDGVELLAVETVGQSDYNVLSQSFHIKEL